MVLNSARTGTTGTGAGTGPGTGTGYRSPTSLPLV